MPDAREERKPAATRAASFKDHFSAHSAAYARGRPGYPPALFEWLAAQALRRDRAWDCATGNGQAARGLATHFKRVIATDASAEQIANAFVHPCIEYRVAPVTSPLHSTRIWIAPSRNSTAARSVRDGRPSGD